MWQFGKTEEQHDCCSQMPFKLTFVISIYFHIVGLY